MMKQEYKAQWLSDLRSGNYTQGTGVLRTYDDKFCCLGVLLDQEDNIWMKDEDNDYYYKTKTGDETGLSEKDLQRYGMTFSEMDILITKNDVDKCTFKEIADWIEACL